MAWFDVVGGIAGGLNQGLGQLQQAQQAKQVEARAKQVEARQLELLKLQQAQDERAQKQFLQQQLEQKEAEFLKGLSLQDPFNVDPAFAVAYPEQAKNYLTMDPTKNTLMARMGPEKKAAAELSLRQIEQRNQLRTQFGTPEFSALPETDRVRLGTQAAAAGIDPKEVLAAVGSLSRRARQDLLTGIISPEKAAELAQRADEAALQSSTAIQAASIRADLDGRVLTPKAALDFITEEVRIAQAELTGARKYLRENPFRAKDKSYMAELATLEAALQQALAKRNEAIRGVPALSSLANTTFSSPGASAGAGKPDPLGLRK